MDLIDQVNSSKQRWLIYLMYCVFAGIFALVLVASSLTRDPTESLTVYALGNVLFFALCAFLYWIVYRMDSVLFAADGIYYVNGFSKRPLRWDAVQRITVHDSLETPGRIVARGDSDVITIVGMLYRDPALIVTLLKREVSDEVEWQTVK